MYGINGTNTDAKNIELLGNAHPALKSFLIDTDCVTSKGDKITIVTETAILNVGECDSIEIEIDSTVTGISKSDPNYINAVISDLARAQLMLNILKASNKMAQPS